MPTPELQNFGRALAALGLTETDLAVALIWYLTQVEDATEVPVTGVAKLMHELSLKGQINVPRLGSRLAGHGDVLRGSAPRTFKIKLSELTRLNDTYEPKLERPKPKVAEHIISKDEFSTTRKYLEAMIYEINGCYQMGFYNGCAVMCRRLMETLLIEAFEHKSLGDKIKAGGEYVGLADIIARAGSGQHIKLARGSDKVMEEIKLLGDAAAHSRTFLARQTDIDAVRLKFRKVIQELAHLAGFS